MVAVLAIPRLAEVTMMTSRTTARRQGMPSSTTERTGLRRTTESALAMHAGLLRQKAVFGKNLFVGIVIGSYWLESLCH